MVIVANAVLLAFSLYIFELHHSWRPDQGMVSQSRVLFVVLALVSLISFAFTSRWWLPAGALGAAFAATPLLSGAGFNLGYVVWAVTLVTLTLILGWAFESKPSAP
jgi:glucan phosphoethanolaminetransferase (alkaline phosphatase superfamily)